MIAALMESPALRKKSFTRVAALMGAVIRAGSCWRMVRSGTRLLNTPVPHSTTANAATAATRVYRLKNTRTALRRTRASTVGVKGVSGTSSVSSASSSVSVSYTHLTLPTNSRV